MEENRINELTKKLNSIRSILQTEDLQEDIKEMYEEKIESLESEIEFLNHIDD